MEDPRFLINPSLKSGVFNLELNESISYANITIPYDAANVTYTANLSIGYFNETTGNYTFVPTTLNTTSHTVIAQVSDLSGTFGVLDKNKYQALPARAQTEMGYIDIVANWIILDSNARFQHTTYYSSMHPFPPGNYTILPSGNFGIFGYQWNTCSNDYHAWDNPSPGFTGPRVVYTDQAGQKITNVSILVVPGASDHHIEFSHHGGPIGILMVPPSPSNDACANLNFTLLYGDGPALPEDLDYETNLNNTAFNKTDFPPYQIAVVHYQTAAGCVLGQAGRKGGMLDNAHSLIPGWNSAINNDVTESTPYMFGHVVCSFVIPLPEIRDFLACGAQGDLLGAVLNALGTGYLGQTRYLLRTGDFIPVLIAKIPGVEGAGLRIMNVLREQGIYEESLPLAEKIGFHEKAFSGGVPRLRALGVYDDVIAGIFDNGGNIEKTIRAGKGLDGRIVWLEEGTSTWGWQHILQRKSQIIKKFGSKTDQEIQDMIAKYNSISKSNNSRSG